MTIGNPALAQHPFLREMFEDAYFPNVLVEKGRQILVVLCQRIERENPADLTALYALTHAATNEFNALAGEFENEGSEIETTARECIGTDFLAIARAYGFDADGEDLIAPREW